MSGFSQLTRPVLASKAGARGADSMSVVTDSIRIHYTLRSSWRKGKTCAIKNDFSRLFAHPFARPTALLEPDARGARRCRYVASQLVDYSRGTRRTLPAAKNLAFHCECLVKRHYLIAIFKLKRCHWVLRTKSCAFFVAIGSLQHELKRLCRGQL